MLPFTNHQRVGWGVVLGVLLSAAAVHAQSYRVPQKPVGGDPLAAGIRLHTPTALGASDASALELNPAALGARNSWNIAFHHSELASDSRVQGTGDALFFATPLPLFDRLVFGFGLQWIRPSSMIGYPDAVKLDFGLALRLANWFHAGFAYHSFICDSDEPFDRLSSLDLGLALYPFQWLGIGFVLRNVTTPVIDGLPVERNYGAELAFRPLRNDRLEFGLGLNAFERRGYVDPQMRIHATITDGFQLFGHLELLRRDFYRDGDPETDLRITTGLSLALEHLTLGVSALTGRGFSAAAGNFGQSEGARSGWQGAQVSVALNGAGRPSLLPGRYVGKVELSGDIDQREMIALTQLCDDLARRKDVRAVLLTISNAQLGLAQAQEFRELVTMIRRRHKQVWTLLVDPGTAAYYVAAASDRVFIDASSDLDLRGFARQQLYFRRLLDHIGVRADILRIAEYKTAPEAVTRSGPSEPAKQMLAALLDDLFRQLVADIAHDRAKPADYIKTLIEVGAFSPSQAQSVGLIDGETDADALAKRASIHFRATVRPGKDLRRKPDRWQQAPAVAVVLIEGEILAGKNSGVPLSARKIAAEDRIIDALNRARNDTRIKAIVLRIDSPGGSARASDRIWQAVSRVQKRKPVIASFSNMAASGGYFAAASADRIFALPGTITGSIGAFGGKVDVSRLLKRIGVNTYTVTRGRHAAAGSPFHPYTDQERRNLLRRLKHTYDRFVSAVAKGRSMTTAEVDKVARGRVWSGAQAQSRTLIDETGGFKEALLAAREAAAIDDESETHVVVLPAARSSFFKKVVNIFFAAETQPSIMPKALKSYLAAIPASIWHMEGWNELALLPYPIAPLR